MTTSAKTTKQYGYNSSISVPITDVILTPATCASLVNEVMKNLLYQRSQIPYPYVWLRSIVRKKRASLDGEEYKSKNFTVNRHYQVVSTAYDCAENVMMHLVKAFTYYGTQLKEVRFVIGPTPYSPKEVFTIRVSSVSQGHVESNHAAENSKRQARILRGIFLENTWMTLTDTSLSCSNTHVFLKLGQFSPENIDKDSLFVPTKPLSLPPSVKHTVIYFDYTESGDFQCCDNLRVFEDGSNVSNPNRIDCSVVQADGGGDNSEMWLQSKELIKGFKDCFINKISASELW